MLYHSRELKGSATVNVLELVQPMLLPVQHRRSSAHLLLTATSIKGIKVALVTTPTCLLHVVEVSQWPHALIGRLGIWLAAVLAKGTFESANSPGYLIVLLNHMATGRQQGQTRNVLYR